MEAPWLGSYGQVAVGIRTLLQKILFIPWVISVLLSPSGRCTASAADPWVLEDVLLNLGVVLP